MTAPEIVTRQNDGAWWSTYNDTVNVWARGERAALADERLLEAVPWPYQGSSPESDVITCVVGETAYAAYWSQLDVISTGPDLESAVEVLTLHVPVPQTTGQRNPDKPPKIEDKPLPPV